MGRPFSLRLVLAGGWRWSRAVGRPARQPLYLTVPKAGLSCFDAGFSLASGTGHRERGDGVSDLSLGPHVTIPMPGKAESLNAAQAATVLLFDAVRRGILRCAPAL